MSYVRSRQESPVFDIVDMIYEFVALAADPDGVTLTEAQRHRLEGLARLLASPVFEVREHARIEVRGPIEFDLPEADEVGVGHVMDIGAGGIGVSTWRPLDADSETTVRFADPASGHAYEFPCRVVWSRSGDNPAMGLRFEGAPTRERIGSRAGLGRLCVGLRLSEVGAPTPGIEFADTGLIAADQV